MSFLLGDLRAFGAAVRREFRQIRRYPIFLFGLLFWPTLLPAVYVLMGRVYSGNDPAAIAAFAERSGVSDVAGFVFVGFSMYMWLSTLLWGPGTALRQEQMRGTLESVFLTPTSRLVVLFGPPLAHLYSTFLMFAVMAVALRVLFGIELAPDAIARTLVVIAVAIPAMYAIAALFSAAVLRYGEIGPAVQFVRGILVLLAGVTYPIVMLPGWAQSVAAVLPSTYVVSDIRAVLLARVGLDAVASHLLIVVGLTVAIGAIAIVTYRLIELDARRTGMLSRY
jgi:ABC-2 type transport system permease protein